jgi:very-short-patch-repair endonuclease
MDGDRRVTAAGGEKPDKQVARLAARQRGLLTTNELHSCGLSDQAIWRRVNAGWLHPIHRGVYAVGHRTLSPEARWLAAVKACGPDAVLSHEAAAALWGLMTWHGPPHVTIPGSAPRHHPGLRIHRTVHHEITIHKAIPVTPPARTLTDLSSVQPFIPLRRAVREAYRNKLITTEELAHARSKQLRRIVADIAPTRNLLEDTVHDLILKAGFELPDVNVQMTLDGHPVTPDFRWPHRNLSIEADGAQDHDHDLARHDDAVRQKLLEAHGDRVVRVSWRQAVLQPARTVARLRDVRLR